MATVAYLGCSTDSQDTLRQREAIERSGIKIDHWLEDHQSRDKAHKRLDFQRLPKAVQAGQVDTIVVAALDRFGVKDAHEMGKFFTILRDHNCRLIVDPEVFEKARATTALNQEGHFRQKAEALKTVVDRIVRHFSRSGKRCRLTSIDLYAAEDGAIRPLSFPGVDSLQTERRLGARLKKLARRRKDAERAD
ncbi:MAG: recombinase family protein [Pirellulales bacterium]|nr:recombinase family protein [Pirellulales bacterium]